MKQGRHVILITGASSGMGREAALQLAGRLHRGSELWLVARRRDRLIELSEELGSRGVRGKVLCGDLLSPAFISELGDRLKREKPVIDILINASGFGKLGALSDMDETHISDMIDLNCRALSLMCRLCIPYMHRGGHIINFASAAAFCPQPWFAVYAATKSYVLSFSEALSEELRSRGIGVTAVCPGPVRTEFFDIAEETEVIPLYKRMFMADKARVVSLALRDSRRGRRVSVYGGSMKTLRLAAHILPSGVIFFFIRLINRR